MNNETKTKDLLLVILGFLSLGALGGGLALIISPTGEMIGLPFSMFKNIPFDSFLIPAIILFTILGLVPLLVIVALHKKTQSKLGEKLNIFKDMHWSWSFTIYIGFALMSWIHIQLIFLQGSVFWLHTFYFFYGILILIVALQPSIRNRYRK